MSFEDQRPNGGPVLPKGPVSQPYRGPRRTHRETGRVEVWVEGSGYVPEDSLDRLTVQERNAVLEARERARSQRETLPLLRRFETLNSTQPTGSVGQIIGHTFNMPALLGDREEAEMRGIINRLTPRQRQGMPGAASDRDVSMFRGSLPGLQNIGDANADIIRNLEREANESQAYAEFLDWYWPQRGTTAGGEEEWGRYMREVPKLDRSWREFFGAQPRQPAGGAGAQPPRRPPNVPPEAQWDSQARRWVME